MKKLLFCLLGMMSSLGYSYAQETKIDSMAVQPLNIGIPIPVSHLSFALLAGANYFSMAPVSPTQYDQLNLSGGGVLDFTINPLIGIGLEYLHNDYSRPYTYMNTEGKLKGGTNDFMLYGSVNLSNAFAPIRSGLARSLNIYGNVGAGLAYYYFDLDFGAMTSNNTNAPATMVGKLGLLAEFTLSDWFNLCFEGQYRQYGARNMGGSIANRNGDALVLTMGLRYKLASGTVKHARNISLCEYAPKPIPVIVKNVIVKGDTEQTLSRLNTVEQENADMKQKIQKMQDEERNTAIHKSLSTQNANLQQKVQNMEVEAQNKAIQKTLVNQNQTLQQKLQKMEADLKLLATQKEGVVNVSLENIEFNSGSNKLALTSYQILDQVAGILKNNSFWSGLKITGHTDNVGSSASNQKLSESRALVVKDYLVSKGVDSSHVIAIGMGENKPVETNDTPQGRQNNRRVEFEITK
jgi:outer membrane protein OmpA-like peptidoglycan-associated protein